MHWEVVRFEGEGGNNLEIKAYAKAIGRGMEREKAVVIATATAKTAEGAREGYTWDKNEINVTIVRVRLWLHNPKRTFKPLCTGCHLDRDNVIANNSGENDAFVQVKGHSDGRTGVWFVPQRVVKHYYIRGYVVRVGRKTVGKRSRFREKSFGT